MGEGGIDSIGDEGETGDGGAVAAGDDKLTSSGSIMSGGRRSFSMSDLRLKKVSHRLGGWAMILCHLRIVKALDRLLDTLGTVGQQPSGQRV